MAPDTRQLKTYNVQSTDYSYYTHEINNFWTIVITESLNNMMCFEDAGYIPKPKAKSIRRVRQTVSEIAFDAHTFQCTKILNVVRIF